MAVPRLLLGDLDGIVRLRAAKPGFDVTDPGLTNEQLVFDSAWPEILAIHQGSWAQAVTAAVETIPVSGGSWQRTYCSVSFPELPFVPMALAWDVTPDYAALGYPSGYPLGGGYYGQSSYRPVQVTSHTDHITATMPAGTMAYVVLANPLSGRDTREDDNAGANGAIIGVHPTRGPGLFVSRRGADVATCPDSDLRLSTKRPAFQIAEAGMAWAAAGTAAISLRRPFPSRPPVILVAGKDGGLASNVGPVVYWVDDQTIYVVLNTSTAQAIQYLIPSCDPAYDDVPDTVPAVRIDMSAEAGLRIAKADLHAATADDDDLLLNSELSALHVSQRAEAGNAGVVAAGNLPIASGVAGVPLGIFGAYKAGRWWCAPGGAWTSYQANYQPVGSPAVPNAELYAYIRDANRIAYAWAAGNTTPNLQVAVIDHSAAAFEEVAYSGTALQAESTYDDFAAATVGAAPAGWTVREYSYPSAVIRIEGVGDALNGRALRSYDAANSGGAVRVSFNAPGSAVGDCDLLLGLKMVNGPLFYPAAALFKFNFVTHVYQLGGLVADVVSGTASDARLFLGPDPAAPVAEHLTGWAYGTWYWLRVNLKGDRRAFKLWPRAEAEPERWSWFTVGPGIASGYVGVSLPSTSTVRAYVDFLSVCTTGRPAWGPI